MRSYRELLVYQKSYGLAVEMYRNVVAQMPNTERYGLIGQIGRAATSIPLNIAEGFAKMSGVNETLRFLHMARGSCAEMEVLLELTRDIGYTEAEMISRYLERYAEVGRMLTGLSHSLKNDTNNY